MAHHIATFVLAEVIYDLNACDEDEMCVTSIQMSVTQNQSNLQNRLLAGLTTSLTRKRLAVLDFDHTVVDDNSDIVARNLIPADQIPARVTNLYKSSGWIPYMQEVFHLLHEQQHSAADIRATIEAIPEVAGFTELIRRLHDDFQFDFVIISDSNSEFISGWNRCHGLDNYIRKVFTNPARFDGNGLLLVQPYHHQTNCALSSENLCKGAVMEAFVEQAQIAYDTVFYIGDGHNDLCPILRLGKVDFGCVRRGYRLEKEIQALVESRVKRTNSANGGNDDGQILDADIIYWDDGHDLLEAILKRIDGGQ